MKTHLLTKINDHSAAVAIIGLGYVGLPLAVAFAESGFPVVGIDVDPSKVDAINQGRSYISDIPSERLRAVATGAGTGRRFSQTNADLRIDGEKMREDEGQSLRDGSQSPSHPII